MAELKTKPTANSVDEFLESVADDERRRDCQTVRDIMRQATRAEPKMWGPSIVGFGSFQYKYASGREGDWFQAGFSPRKRDLTLYINIMSGFDRQADLMSRLGKYKTGKSCLYIRRLADVNLDVLKELIEESIKHLGKVRFS